MDSVAPEKSCRPRRLKRLLKWLACSLLVLAVAGVYSVKDEIRTLASLRRIAGTDAYVMDYYCDYNLEHIRTNGINLASAEDTYIEAFFSFPIEWIAKTTKSFFVSDSVQVSPISDHHCSTVVFRNSRGETIFGRNFDWMHNTSLTLRTHQEGKLQSVAMIDLAYLDLDKSDLDKTGYIERLPLLFSPYYLMDGMNSHGLAISDMTLESSQVSQDSDKPNVLHSTAMRLILDYTSTTPEAIDLLSTYNIRFGDTPCHFMIADSHGQSAVVEFIDGKMRSTPAESNWQACTNSQIWEATEEECDQSCDRYRVASQQLSELNSNAGAKEVMGIMQAVSVENWTMWSSVYNLSTGELLLAHRKSSNDVHRVPFAVSPDRL